MSEVKTSERSDAYMAHSCSTLSRPKLLPFDHIQPAPETILNRPPHTAVLYGSLASNNFRELHEYLYKASSKRLSSEPHIEYVLRHIPPAELKDTGAETTYLSGYGVALDLKKMDYLALDDRRQGAATESWRITSR